MAWQFTVATVRVGHRLLPSGEDLSRMHLHGGLEAASRCVDTLWNRAHKCVGAEGLSSHSDLGTVVPTCNPSMQEAEIDLGYIKNSDLA